MSSDVHDTLWSTEEQHRAWLDNQWEDEVVARLPADLEVQAAKHKAWRRKRAIKSAADLLRALLAYVLCAPSFRRLGAWAVLIGLANICEKAWRKHLRQANVWLLWLCGELIASPVASHWLRERQTGRVLIVDATCIRQVGGSGDDWRLHTAYDLCAGRRGLVSITDRHGGEGFSYYGLQAGDIVVADRGYGFRCSVAYAAGRGAYVVLRFVLKNFPVEDEQGEAIDLLAWAEQSSEPVCSRCCYSRWEGQRALVRVIIRRLSEEEESLAREQLLKKAKKNGRTVSEQAWKAAGWLWLVTTLPGFGLERAGRVALLPRALAHGTRLQTDEATARTRAGAQQAARDGGSDDPSAPDCLGLAGAGGQPNPGTAGTGGGRGASRTSRGWHSGSGGE